MTAIIETSYTRPRFLDPTHERVRRLWWQFFAPQLVLTLAVRLVVAVTGSPAKIYLQGSIAARGVAVALIAVAAIVLAETAFWLIVCFAAMWYALGHSFSDFRVVLSRPTGVMTTLPRTFARVARITWGYTWRLWVCGLAIGIVLGLPIAILSERGKVSMLDSPLATALDVVVWGTLSYYVFYRYIPNGFVGDVQVRLTPLAETTQANAAAPAPIA